MASAGHSLHCAAQSCATVGLLCLLSAAGCGFLASDCGALVVPGEQGIDAALDAGLADAVADAAISDADRPEVAGSDSALADVTVTDADLADAPTPDVAWSDGPHADRSVADGTQADGPLPDAADPDAALPDAAPVEAGEQDGAQQDAAQPDTALPDAAQPDAALPDAAQPDAAMPDAAQPDAAMSDAAMPDTSQPDGSSNDGGSGPPSCGRFGALHDDFEDGERGPQWAHSYSDPGTSLLESGGLLQISLASQAQGNRWAAYATPFYVPLIDDAATVEITEVPAAIWGAQIFFSFDSKQDRNHFSIWVDGGRLRASAETQTGHQDNLGRDPTFDPEEHRWWRMSESQGSVYLQASPDAVTWTTLVQASTPSTDMLGGVSLGAGTYQRILNPGSARFDNFSTLAPEPYCPASSFSDDFSGNDLYPRWYLDDDFNCNALVGGGQLTLTAEVMGSFDCGAWSYQGYNLEESEVLVEVSGRSTSSDKIDYGLSVQRWPDVRALIFFRGDTVIVWVDELQYWDTAPSQDWSWLRISKSSGKLYFWASGDGQNWSQLWEMESSADYSYTEIELSVSLASGSSTAGLPPIVSGSFDNLNLPPP